MADIQLYFPDELPDEYNRAFIQYEFEKIARVLAAFEAPTVILVPQAIEPERPQEGMVANADGTNWDPGHGVGLYEYKNAEWSPLFMPIQGIVTSTVEVVNTTTETEIYSETIAAAALHAGDVSELRIGGSYDVNTGGDTWTLRIKVEGTTIHTIQRQSNGNVTDAGWLLEIISSIRTEGVSGTLLDIAILTDDDSSYTESDAATHTIDTTSDNTISVTVQWGAASVNNSFRLQHGIVEHKH